MLADLYIESVLEKCRALKTCGLWAPEPHVRPAAWLDNFKSDPDRLIAAIILDNFVYYSERAASRLLRTAYHRLEDEAALGQLRPTSTGPVATIGELLFTPIEGEEPRPTDSGKTVCKVLRDVMELKDERFVEPREAVASARSGKPIVLVDDFLGSGQQLVKTWRRAYLDSSPRSLEEAFAHTPFAAVCLAMVTTQQAIDYLRSAGIPIRVIATHVLDDTYSIQNLDAPLLSPPLSKFQASLRDFLSRHSGTLSLESFLRLGDQPLFGFHELGLIFAVQGGVPDSTIPILWAKGTGNWIRLVRKNA